MLYRPSSSRRSGLTLLELVVVLMILVALAGIVVPLISNTLSQTRYSTTGTNLPELARLLNAYQFKFSKYPDGWDTLTVGTALAAYLPGNAPIAGGTTTTILGTYVTTITVTGGDATTTTLSNSGIANVYPFVAAPANPTFYPYGTAESTPGPTPGSTLSIIPTPTVISTAGVTATLATLTPAGAQKLNLPITPTMPTYIILGLGGRNTMIPKTILDAPVKFSDNALSGPNAAYCRFGVVFQVTDTSGNPLPLATMVCVVDFSNEQGISTLGNQIENYYNSIQVGQ